MSNSLVPTNQPPTAAAPQVPAPRVASRRRRLEFVADVLNEYLSRVVAGKTGSLIATSARYGAMFGGARPEVVEALSSYGEIVGSAFQLTDDILDITSESDTSGKTPGTDLREGVPTLPVLMAQASTDPADARLLSLLTWSRVTDPACGYRAVRTSSLRGLEFRQDQFHNSEFIVEASKKHLRSVEVPVTVTNRLSGRSKKPPHFRYGMGFANALMRAWLR